MTVVNCFRSLYLWVDLQRDEDNGVLRRVVNCFRSLYLWVDLQRRPRERRSEDSCELLSFFVPLGWFTAQRSQVIGYKCCELLSFFVPLGWFTAGHLTTRHTQRLWIAFVLCTFGLIYSERSTHQKLWCVVNCFRSLYLWVDLQRDTVNVLKVPCCELLSFFVPLGWFTAPEAVTINLKSLWIAFVLCTFGLIYSVGKACQR